VLNITGENVDCVSTCRVTFMAKSSVLYEKANRFNMLLAAIYDFLGLYFIATLLLPQLDIDKLMKRCFFKLMKNIFK
jgi:hypothetical protein